MEVMNFDAQAVGLTPHELETLAHIAEGHTTKGVARLLNRSPCTVNDYIKSAFLKLDVHDRTHAVVKCFRMGILR